MDGMTRAELLALPVAVDLVTAARALGIGRTRAFELARRDAFPVPVLRVGVTYRVPTAHGVARHGGRGGYRAVDAERVAVVARSRPKVMAVGPVVGAAVGRAGLVAVGLVAGVDRGTVGT
jgi:hypothetical protein